MIHLDTSSRNPHCRPRSVEQAIPNPIMRWLDDHRVASYAVDIRWSIVDDLRNNYAGFPYRGN